MILKLELFAVLAALNSLFLLAGAVGSAATLAISQGSGTVCGVSAGTVPTVYCTNISSSSNSSYQILYTVPFASVAGGTDLTCALKSSGTSFFCWDGSGVVRRVYNGSAVLSDLIVGETQISAVDRAGEKLHWWRGEQRFPKSVLGTYNSLTSGRNFTCGIDSNDTVTCWGPLRSSFQSEFDNKSMSIITAGDSHVCGLDTSGFLTCKGSNSSGESAVPTGNAFEFTSLALGSSHTCALQQPNGTAICWGGTGSKTGTYFPANGTEFEFLVAGGNLTCGLTIANYSVFCWYSNQENISVFQLSLPRILPGICVKNEERCACGTYAGSASLCSGTGLICNPCNSRTDTGPSPVPTVQPPSALASPSSSRRKVGIGWKVFAIVGTVEHTNNGTGLSISGGNGVKFPRSSSVPRVNVFTRQWSHPLNRQRSGPSSFKDRAEEFSFEQLEKATNYFSLDSKIGAGSFGTVYRARLADGREVAIKRGDSSPRNRRRNEKESAFQSELGFLSRLHHKHLVGLVGFCTENEERLLVYEFMKNGALYDHLHPKNPNFGSPVLSSWKMRIKILLDASRGIEYLHNYAVPPIIHRDIKSSNILLDQHYVARVSDFGLSLLGPETEGGSVPSKAAGTVGYMDPEYYGFQNLTVKSDVYSFGVVILEVITGRKAIFKGEEELINVVDFAVEKIVMGDISEILDRRVEKEEGSEIEAVELVANLARRCVENEGRMRPLMAEVVSNLETAMAVFEGSLKWGSDSSKSMSVGSIEARE
ncbi:hypothetical protein LUZ60_003774 [Juncus effusus]|nr:hypothetical protein LUZ60_003774 [Juncus effusus]